MGDEQAAELLAVCRELLSYVEAEYGFQDIQTDESDETGSGVLRLIAQARRVIREAGPPDPEA
jgi:hypothetical protein